MSAYLDVTKRHDFLMLFDVKDGNPNGDPDSGNMPRIDPETMQGLVTDVCLKRKVRNQISTAADPDNARMKTYVEHRGVLHKHHRRAYNELRIPLGTPVSEQLTPEASRIFKEAEESIEWPEGFRLEVDPINEDAPVILHYSGELEPSAIKDAYDKISEPCDKRSGEVIERVCKALVKKSGKAAKPSRDQVEAARTFMCKNFYDIRAFGAVMSTTINCGQVRGPLQLTFSRSIDKIFPRDLAITRVAVTKEEDSERKVQDFGRKAFLPYGLYRGFGFFSPSLAKDTGFDDNDLAHFWQALLAMWDNDHSASRGLMSIQKLFVFTHEKSVGNAAANKLFERISFAELEDGAKPPRSFSDYTNRIRIDTDNLQEGITMTELVSGNSWSNIKA